jgi:hypothetical protein
MFKGLTEKERDAHEMLTAVKHAEQQLKYLEGFQSRGIRTVGDADVDGAIVFLRAWLEMAHRSL